MKSLVSHIRCNIYKVWGRSRATETVVRGGRAYCMRAESVDVKMSVRLMSMCLRGSTGASLWRWEMGDVCV